MSANARDLTSGKRISAQLVVDADLDAPAETRRLGVAGGAPVDSRLDGFRPVISLVPIVTTFWRKMILDMNAALACDPAQISGLSPKVEEVAVMKSRLLAEELPKLRRYARALTGSQASGDAYVVSALEALIADVELVAEIGSPRVALYKMFAAIWNAIDINRQPNFDETAVGPERHLACITPLPRQAFLLLTLEDFSEDAAADILGVDVLELRRLADKAAREMATAIATDILIIEDEPMISMELESLVETLGHSVAGVARTHNESVVLARARRPGMILADIRLADASSGLDAVNELVELFEVPVIFITAYPEQFLTGRRPEPAFLIPKPFQLATVAGVISQALFFERRAKAQTDWKPLLANVPANARN